MAVQNIHDHHWIEISKRIHWMKPWTKLKNISFTSPVQIQWYLNGKLNVSANCVDRHALATPDKTALIFEPDNANEASLKITYQELLTHVCRMANILKKHGVKSALLQCIDKDGVLFEKVLGDIISNEKDTNNKGVLTDA